MRRAKRRLRQVISRYPAVRLRRLIDPDGDTGCFLITTYETPELAKRINEALRAEGIVTYPQGASNILMTRWGLHLYYNNLNLLRRASVDGRGFPWNLPANQGLGGSYEKGSCPVADNLFERSILLPIPSCLTPDDEGDLEEAFEKVLSAYFTRRDG
jgi:8-amino-3,8-dideoxy-alpha-D-manno-octulosonate transaminase